jgi:predicted AlkP superfamily pyrophosphatase or phosphodiesterase
MNGGRKRLLKAAVAGWLMAALAIWAAGAHSEEAATAADPIVIVLSWDGMRHDYPDLAVFPALDRVAREGVRAGRLTPVFPSSTFPGHVSMATGTYPDRHGIVDNAFLDADKGRYAYSSDANWVEAEPLWIASERQGVKTATYFWVGSETDWRDQGTSYRIAPFDGKRPEHLKVDQILAWLDLPEPERPRLIMSYWAGADSVGHDHGPNAESVVEQIRSQDEQLARLLAGIDERDLWPHTTLIIVSDHGMTVSTDYLNLQGALAEAGIQATVIGAAVGQIHLADPAQTEAAKPVIEAFLAEVDGFELHRGTDLPEEFRLDYPSRMGDWVAVLPPPYAFRKTTAAESALLAAAKLMGKEFGMHGYDPALPDMGGIFLAMGRGVPRNQALTEVHQIDLTATVAALLGIDPPAQSEGRSIW